MKLTTQINEQLSIEQIKNHNRTIISVIDGKDKILLSDIKTNDYFWSKFVFNDTYIVAYSRGCMVNQIPLNIEAAYNIKEKKLIDLDKKTKVLLEYMLICKRGFDLANVLQEINEHDLGILEEIEKEDLRTYLTIGNKDIPQEQVINHILSTYPQLKDYTNLESPLSVIEYRDILNNLENSTFYFHIMEQDLGFVKPTITPIENTPTDYNQVNITEYNHTQKVLKKHKR